MKKNYCIDCGKEIYLNAKRCRSCCRKGELNCNYIRHCCIDCGKRLPRRKWKRCRECYIKFNRKENHPRYIGGRKGDIWKEAVLKRENYMCQKCESKENLCGHHGNNKRDFPNQIYNIDNGFCLCQTCHKRYHLGLRNKKLTSTVELTLQFLGEK